MVLTALAKDVSRSERYSGIAFGISLILLYAASCVAEQYLYAFYSSEFGFVAAFDALFAYVVAWFVVAVSLHVFG